MRRSCLSLIFAALLAAATPSPSLGADPPYCILDTVQSFDVEVPTGSWGMVYYHNYSFPEFSASTDWHSEDFSFNWNYSNYGWHGFFTYDYNRGAYTEAHFMLGEDWA